MKCDYGVKSFNGSKIIIVQKHENGDRVRTHKKKRIDKKWLKKYGYYNGLPLEKGKVYCIDNMLYMSKQTFDIIKNNLDIYYNNIRR